MNLLKPNKEPTPSTPPKNPKKKKKQQKPKQNKTKNDAIFGLAINNIKINNHVG